MKLLSSHMWKRMHIIPFALEGCALICDINSMQDISLFVDMYFRFGIVLRNICQKKSNYCAYIVSNKTE